MILNYPPNISNKLCNKQRLPHSWFINNALQRGLQINSSMKQKLLKNFWNWKNQNRIRNITSNKSLKIHEITERRTQTQTLKFIQNPYSWILQNIFYIRKKCVLYLKTHYTSYIQLLSLFLHSQTFENIKVAGSPPRTAAQRSDTRAFAHGARLPCVTLQCWQQSRITKETH